MSLLSEKELRAIKTELRAKVNNDDALAKRRRILSKLDSDGMTIIKRYLHEFPQTAKQVGLPYKTVTEKRKVNRFFRGETIETHEHIGWEVAQWYDGTFDSVNYHPICVTQNISFFRASESYTLLNLAVNEEHLIKMILVECIRSLRVDEVNDYSTLLRLYEDAIKAFFIDALQGKPRVIDGV